jgi:hypothetical protein
MAILPDNAVALIADDEVEKYQVVRIADEIVVDLLKNACGVDYSRARTGRNRDQNGRRCRDHGRDKGASDRDETDGQTE